MNQKIKHVISMVNPKTGHRDCYSFDHTIGEELKCIFDFWRPAGFCDFLIDGKPVDDAQLYYGDDSESAVEGYFSNVSGSQAGDNNKQ